MYKKLVLPNGLRILAVPSKNTKIATVLALVGTGSKYETKETSGISHFLEHLFFKGTKKRPDQAIIAETIDKVGGIMNAFTGQDYTGYYAKTDFSKFELALEWVSDIYLNSLLPKEEIERERGVIIEEINMYYDHPMSYIDTLWRDLLYGNQPAGWDIAGTKETVSKMTREQLFDYRLKQYVADNTIICVSGNVSPVKVFELTKKYFSSINTTSSIARPKVLESQSQPQIKILKKRTDQTHIAFGVRGYDLFHPQRYTLELISIILGGMMSSRLFLEVREKLGLAYYIKTETDINPDTGSLVTFAGVDNKRIDSAIEVILKEYKKIVAKPVPEKELQKAKDNFIGRTAIALEQSDSLASYYAAQELLEGKIIEPETVFEKIRKITQKDVSSVTRDIFCPEKLNLAVIGPYENGSRFENLLKMN